MVEANNMKNRKFKKKIINIREIYGKYIGKPKYCISILLVNFQHSFK